MNKDSLGDRMKGYENVSRNYLTARTPVVVRIDGKAFHTFTRQCEKPFDKELIRIMVNSAKELARNMQGFKIGYVQSDEASFVITDYDDINSQGWFNYNLSKIISISSSIMTAGFNHLSKFKGLAYFDARAFNIPESDISNYLIWRAKDWERNSLQMYARHFFSHKQLHKKNRVEIHEMLHSIGKNWSTDLTEQKKNGTLLIKGEEGISLISDIDISHNFFEELLIKVGVIK